jgi:hypothetical protein
VRLFSATPPAIPASAAPPATSGVFAFEATSATFSPVLRTALAGGFAFAASCETFSVVALAPLRLVDRLFVVDLLDLLLLFVEPFRLVDLFVLGRPRVARLLEDRVVWAISLASLGFRASCACRAGGASPLPGVLGFEQARCAGI